MSALTSTIQNYIYGPDKFSKPKKNFIKENMRFIKKIQKDGKEVSVKSECKKDFKKHGKKMDEQKSSGRVQSSYEAVVHDGSKMLVNENKEQGCQTAFNDLEGAQIRFPNDRPKTPPPPTGKKNSSLQVDPMFDLVYNQKEASILAPSNLPIKEDGKVDFVRLNMMIAPKKKPSLERPDPIKPPRSYQRGVIPKYLRDAKKQQIEEVQEKGLVEIIDEFDENSYTLVSEEEKRERLREIRMAYASLVTELNTLPLRSDTPKIVERKEYIEATLQKLEDGIKLFSRDKLYVKMAHN